jgi:hypothetical protein
MSFDSYHRLEDGLYSFEPLEKMLRIDRLRGGVLARLRADVHLGEASGDAEL